MFNAISLSSPVGTLQVYENQSQIIALEWGGEAEGQASDLLMEARDQLNAYFDGKLQRFDLPLCLSGSDFQKAVSREMLEIPYGQTRTYGDIARALQSSAQPVGGACGRNPIPILIPCHRVMGADDKMTGFSGSGGIQTKQKLLKHEGWTEKQPDLFG